MTSSISYTEIIENKNQLEKVSDVIPEKAAYRRVGKNRSSSLLIEDIRLHCRYSDRDACDKVYDYAGQKAHVLYQSDTFIGNVVYEIKVGEQDIYSFEEQVAYFKDEKTKQHQQWFFVFLLFIIPAYWFYKHDKRINKSMPKLTDLEVAEFKEKQREETENQGCAVLLGVILFLGVAICCGLAGLIYLAVHEFGLSAIFLVLCIISGCVLKIILTPAKRL